MSKDEKVKQEIANIASLCNEVAKRLGVNGSVFFHEDGGITLGTKHHPAKKEETK